MENAHGEGHTYGRYFCSGQVGRANDAARAESGGAEVVGVLLLSAWRNRGERGAERGPKEEREERGEKRVRGREGERESKGGASAPPSGSLCGFAARGYCRLRRTAARAAVRSYVRVSGE